MTPNEFCRSKTGVAIGDVVMRPDGKPFWVKKLSRLDEEVPFLHLAKWPEGTRSQQIGLDRFNLEKWRIIDPC
jgi:hypothetical protein